MDLITKILLFVIFLCIWILWGYIVSVNISIVHNQTKEEYNNPKYKFLYLLRLSLEGPFVMLRILNK